MREDVQRGGNLLAFIEVGVYPAWFEVNIGMLFGVILDIFGWCGRVRVGEFEGAQEPQFEEEVEFDPELELAMFGDEKDAFLVQFGVGDGCEQVFRDEFIGDAIDEEFFLVEEVIDIFKSGGFDTFDEVDIFKGVRDEELTIAETVNKVILKAAVGQPQFVGE